MGASLTSARAMATLQINTDQAGRLHERPLAGRHIPLLLTTTEQRLLGADLGLIPVREVHDEVVAVGLHSTAANESP